MIKADLLNHLENLSQEDLRDVALRAAELLHVKHGLEMTTLEREVLERRLADVQNNLDIGKDWPNTRARLIERLSW